MRGISEYKRKRSRPLCLGRGDQGKIMVYCVDLSSFTGEVVGIVTRAAADVSNTLSDERPQK